MLLRSQAKKRKYYDNSLFEEFKKLCEDKKYKSIAYLCEQQQWNLENDKLEYQDVHKFYNLCAEYLCINQLLEIISKIYKFQIGFYVFLHACKRNYLEVVKVILDKKNTHTLNFTHIFHGLRYSGLYNNYEIMVYVHNRFKEIYPHSEINPTCIIDLSNSRLNITKVLEYWENESRKNITYYAQYQKDIEVIYSEAFKRTLKNNNYDLCKYFISKDFTVLNQLQYPKHKKKIINLIENQCISLKDILYNSKISFHNDFTADHIKYLKNVKKCLEPYFIMVLQPIVCSFLLF